MIQYLCEIWHSFRKEVRDFRKNFSWNICIEAMVLRLFLPLNDIVSDFLIAKKSNNTIKDKSINSWVTFFSYYFIACPGIMFLLSNLHMSSVRLGNIQSNCFKIFLLPFILSISPTTTSHLGASHSKTNFRTFTTFLLSRIVYFLFVRKLFLRT